MAAGAAAAGAAAAGGAAALASRESSELRRHVEGTCCGLAQAATGDWG